MNDTTILEDIRKFREDNFLSGGILQDQVLHEQYMDFVRTTYHGKNITFLPLPINLWLDLNCTELWPGEIIRKSGEL